MASRFTAILFFSTMLALCLTLTSARVRQKCKDEWDCDYGEYCHFKKKTCQRSNSGCVLSAQQISCMLLVGEGSLTKSFQDLACDVVTTDVTKKKTCDAIFEGLEGAAKTACGVALAQICCPQRCPENYGKEACKKFGNSYKCD